MQDLFDRLDVLADDRSAWHLELTRHSAKVGNLNLVIDQGEIETAWMVEDPAAEEMVSNGWKPEATLRRSMKECTDFARAYLISANTPQHIED